MLIVGLVGGIASGKSRVADHFEQLGAVVLNADQIGHQVLEFREVQQQLAARWGKVIFDEDQNIDRGAIAGIVFEDGIRGATELEFLESITHPEIARQLESAIDSARMDNAQVVIIDAPVMLKTGWDRYCNEILFIEANNEQRLDRARKRGWTEDMFLQREKSQTSLQEKRRRSDRVIDNSGSWNSTVEQLSQLWHHWIDVG